MNDIQEQLFSMLCRIDGICREFGIIYTLQGGTLLGAVRENGFISWDDDVDIAMPRDNYERFIEVFSTYSTEFTLLEGYTGGALQVFSKTDPYATVDIFVYDYITDNKFLQKIRNYCIIILQAAIKNKETIKLTGKQEHGAFKYYAYRCVSFLARPIPKKIKLRFYKWFSRNVFTGKKAYMHMSNDSARYLHRIIPAEYVFDLIEQEFEGKNFYIFKNYDAVLKLSYGDNYMTPREDLLQQCRHKRFRDSLFNK